MKLPYDHPSRKAERKIPNKLGLTLDTANPAFFIKGYRAYGKALSASYSMRSDESPEEYWKRVKTEIA